MCKAQSGIAMTMTRSEGGRSKTAIKHGTHVVHLAQVIQEGAKVGKLGIVRVVEPATDRNRIVRMEDVGRGRVVDDDRIGNVPSQLGKVFDVVALVVVARFTKQTVSDHPVNVQNVQHRVRVLNERVSASRKEKNQTAPSQQGNAKRANSSPCSNSQ